MRIILNQKTMKIILAENKDELKAYSKFDFVPGENVIFFEDFAQDNIGDFPALWNTNGSAEVVTTNLYPGKLGEIFNARCHVD